MENLYKTKILYLILFLNVDTNHVSCIDHSQHSNYHMLPQPPECGVSSIVGNSFVNSRIKGGLETKLGEFPWAVHLKIFFYTDPNRRHVKGEDFGFCSGSLISDQYVLTAAHCFDYETPYTRGLAYLGDWMLQNLHDRQDTLCAPPRQQVNISTFVVHYKYNDKSFIYDMAVVRLAEKILFSTATMPICLPAVMYHSDVINDHFLHTRLVVSGWGAEGHQQSTGSKILKKLSARVIPSADCRVHWTERNGLGELILETPPSDEFLDAILCLQNNEEDMTCEGDSGGMAMSTHAYGNLTENAFVLVGVTSLGQDCFTKTSVPMPMVETSVVSLMEWILDTMQE